MNPYSYDLMNLYFYKEISTRFYYIIYLWPTSRLYYFIHDDIKFII